MTVAHRRIWEAHYGPIPKEVDGRSLEIHLIDGNHINNDITNLKLVTIQEHYDIHKAQGDYDACVAISIRMSVLPEEISKLNSIAATKRIKEGNHPFLQGAGNTKKTCKYCGAIHRAVNIKRWHDDNCIFNPAYDVNNQKQRLQQQKQLLNNNPGNIKKTCEYCNKTIAKSAYSRWHGNNCKENNNVVC